MIEGYDAVILAGGRGSRLGASKPDLRVGGLRLLDIALAAASGAGRIVVVGDVDVPTGVLRTREEPAFGGPVAALARLADRGEPPLRALYRLLGPLHLLGVDPGTASVDDLDTPADAARWTTILAAEERP
jgi:CTP:molybdopterin cytidylyltransferase MocA